MNLIDFPIDTKIQTCVRRSVFACDLQMSSLKSKYLLDYYDY